MTTDTSSSNTAAMTAGRRADTLRRRERVLKVLNAATTSGQEISVSTIARQAGIDRTFLYRHRDLLERVHAAEAQPANAIGIGAGRQSRVAASRSARRARTRRPAGRPGPTSRTASVRVAR